MDSGAAVASVVMIYLVSNSSIFIIVTYFWHPGDLFLSNQGGSRCIRCVNIHQLKQCFLSAEVQGLHWQSFHQRTKISEHK